MRVVADAFDCRLPAVASVAMGLKPLAPVAATSLDEEAGCLAKPGRQRLSEAQTQAAIKARLKARHSAA